MFSLKHAFTSLVEDEDDDSIVRPSDWNREHSITASAFSVLGRGGDADGDVSAIVADTESTFLGRFSDGVRFGVITAAVVSGLGSAALASTSDFATAAQGALAQTAVQPGSLGNLASLNAGSGLTISGSNLLANVQSVNGMTGAVIVTAGDISGLGYFATGTDAANLTGTVASARISGAYGGITGVGTLASGAVPTSLLTGTLGATQFPALTGDVTTAGGALATTLATVNATVGSFGSATASGTFTVNAKGLITAAANVTITPAVGSITGFGTGVATALGNTAGGAGGFALASTNPYNLTGDVTSAGSVTTLATAQPAVHTWALSQTFTVAPIFTDASGSRTALGLGSLATLSAAPAGTLTGTTLASNVVTSSLTTIGTLVGGSIPTSLITGLAAVATSGSASDLSTGTLPSARIDLTAAYAFTGLGATTILKTAIGVTTTDGLIVTNTTAAANGAQQWSPRTRWSGQVWDTTSSSSKAVDWISEIQSVQGGTAALGNNLVFSARTNAGTWRPVWTAFQTGDTNALGILVNGGSLHVTNAADIGQYGNWLALRSSYQFGWSSATDPISLQTIWTSPSAAVSQLGATTGSGAAVAQTLTVQGSSGNSAAAALFTIAGSDQSGTGANGGNTLLRAGNASGASGTRNGGTLTLAGGTGPTVGGDVAIQIAATTSLTDGIRVKPTGSVVLNSAAVATNATDGFLYIASGAGTPTGAPTAFTGRVALYYDTTNHQFWIYDGAWLQPKTPAGAAVVTWQ